jgi:hypothetical protein
MSNELTVIVELDIPKQRVVAKPRGFLVMDTIEEAVLEEKRGEAAKLIENVVGKPPRWLKTARAFVVTALPKQIEKISSSPLIKAVHPSKNLQP